MLLIYFVRGNIYANLCPCHSIIHFVSFVLNISLEKYCAEGAPTDFNDTERSRTFINTPLIGKNCTLLVALDIHSRSLKIVLNNVP